MQNPQHAISGRPAWQRRSRRRLAVCMLFAALLLAATSLLLHWPDAAMPVQPAIRLSILEQEAQPESEQDQKQHFEPVAELPAPPQRSVRSLYSSTAVQEPADVESRDWYASIGDAAIAAVDAANHVPTLHPGQQEMRRRAGLQFAPSRAPVSRPVWENVEIDQMGRKVLVSGDCYRVLEDWRATYQEIQREFGQYLVYCSNSEHYPIDVDWVDEIGQKYAAVRFPDG